MKGLTPEHEERFARLVHASPLARAHFRLMDRDGFTPERVFELLLQLGEQNVELVNQLIDKKMKEPPKWVF